MGYSLFVTFNCACTRTILYVLWTDAISAVEYLFFIEPKIAFSVYGSEKPSYQRTVRWTMQGLTEPFSEYRLLLSFYRGENSRGVYSTERVISQQPNDAYKKKKNTLRQALEYVKNCRSGLLLITLGCSAGQILVQSLTAHERQFVHGNPFLLAVCTHEVPLYLCSIFCSRSLVQLKEKGKITLKICMAKVY